MRALVTGATGFVGANIVAALNQAGWSVRALHRPQSRLTALAGLAYESALGDVLDRDSVVAATRGCQVVFHAAGVADYWRADQGHMFRVNVEGTRNVMAAARQAGVERVVHTSSAAALGIPDDGRAIDETHTWNVPPERFPYGHSKYLAEQVVQEAVAQGLPAVIVNPTVVLGPRDVNLGSVTLILAVHKRRMPVLLPGGLNAIGAADVAAGHLLAATQGRIGERYLLGTENLTTATFAQLVGETIGAPVPRLMLPRGIIDAAAAVVGAANRLSPWRLPVTDALIRLSIETFYFDARKARDELGIPQTPLRQVVRETYDWLRAGGYLD